MPAVVLERADNVATTVVETPGGSFTQPLLRWHSITQSSWSWDNLLEE